MISGVVKSWLIVTSPDTQPIFPLLSTHTITIVIITSIHLENGIPPPTPPPPTSLSCFLPIVPTHGFAPTFPQAKAHLPENPKDPKNSKNP